MLGDYSTAELVRELKTRLGVQTMIVMPYQDAYVKVDPFHYDVNGPAIILIVTD